MSKARLPLAVLVAGSLILLIRPALDPRDDWPAVKEWVRDQFPAVEQISVETLKVRLGSDTPPLLLDVRQEAEYRVSHLPGALRIDPDAVDIDLPEGIDPATPIVAYCSVGYRSSALVERLRRQGYTRVTNLEGSIFEWANKGYPLVRDGQAVRQVHPFDETWGRWLDPDLRAYTVD